MSTFSKMTPINRITLGASPGRQAKNLRIIRNQFQMIQNPGSQPTRPSSKPLCAIGIRLDQTAVVHAERNFKKDPCATLDASQP